MMPRRTANARARSVALAIWLMSVAMIAAPASVDDGPAIYARSAAGVMLIRAAGAKADSSIVSEVGTGFVISDSGYVLTASHVIPNAADFKALVLSGALGPDTVATPQAYGLELIGRHKDYDVALLRISGTPKDLRPLPLRTKAPVAGEQLFVLGYPLGLSDVHFLDGRVSAVNASDITTNALINRGNSGGPVVDSNGCVIGIVYSGIESFNGNLVTGIKFAVPLVAIRDLVPTDTGTAAKQVQGAPITTVIHVSDTLTRTQTDHPIIGDAVKQYQDRIDARAGYVIDAIELIGKNSLNPPALPYPIPQIAPDGKSMTFVYSLISGPIYDQRRGWIDMTINTRQKPDGKSAGPPPQNIQCQ